MKKHSKMLNSDGFATGSLVVRYKMHMKILIIFFLAFSGSAYGEPLPVDNDIYTELKSNPKKYTEKEVAFEGEIIGFTDSGKNTPYFKISLSGQESELWSALLFKTGEGKGINVGNIVRIYGYYAPFDSGIYSVGENNTGFHLLTFCIANLSTNEKFYFPHGIKQCEEWEKGE